MKRLFVTLNKNNLTVSTGKIKQGTYVGQQTRDLLDNEQLEETRFLY